MEIKRHMSKNKKVKKDNFLEKKDPNYQSELKTYGNPIASREFILETLTKLKKPTSAFVLARELQIKGGEAKDALAHRLFAMVRDGQLISKDGKYQVPDKDSAVVGKIFTDKERIKHFLPENGSSNSIRVGRTDFMLFTDDRVSAFINSYIDKAGNAKVVATVEKLLEDKEILVSGTVSKLRDSDQVIPFKRSYSGQAITCRKHKFKLNKDDVVLVKIDREASNPSSLIGDIVKKLGSGETVGVEVESAINSYGLSRDWPAEVEKQSTKIAKRILPSDKKDRIDLRDLPFVTIDGDDSKDFDDAVYCERKKNDGWQLFVAIADVSHYVKEGNELDKEAKKRGNSTYFPEYVVPMLPEVLSNDLCSLNPNVDRLALVCEMTISAEGKLTRYLFYPATIHSHARLTYDKVASMLENNKKIRSEYKEIVNHIDELNYLYKALRKQRDVRGAIDFDTVEPKFVYDKHGEIDGIVATQRKISHMIIEECMLCANVATAKFLKKHKIPHLLRSHPEPVSAKLEELRAYLKTLRINLPRKEKITAKDYAEILKLAKKRDDFQSIQMGMLRSLSQANYVLKGSGHFGLGYAEYTHFTSPIRRYTDLLNHRAIKRCLEDKPLKDNEKTALTERLKYLGEHLSSTERNSDDASRDAVSGLKCRFVSQKVGERFVGRVTGVTEFGLFIELVDLYVDGLLHIKNIGYEYFSYDRNSAQLIGQESGEAYALGDMLRVVLQSVDKVNRRIDLRLLSRAGQSTSDKENGKSKKSKGRKKLDNRKKVDNKKPGRSRKKADPKKKTEKKKFKSSKKRTAKAVGSKKRSKKG